MLCLETFADLRVKRKFINTFDAFLHAQSLGETFGLSIAEASEAGKPTITWNGGRAREHLRILGDKCIHYETADELYAILTGFDPAKARERDWNAYGDYSPEKVMKQFDTVFLDPLRKHLSTMALPSSQL
jgi:glycosyltransferase involved in cell wall biosynthesis